MVARRRGFDPALSKESSPTQPQKHEANSGLLALFELLDHSAKNGRFEPVARPALHVPHAFAAPLQ